MGLCCARCGFGDQGGPLFRRSFSSPAPLLCGPFAIVKVIQSGRNMGGVGQRRFTAIYDDIVSQGGRKCKSVSGLGVWRASVGPSPAIHQDTELYLIRSSSTSSPAALCGIFMLHTRYVTGGWPTTLLLV